MVGGGEGESCIFRVNKKKTYDRVWRTITRETDSELVGWFSNRDRSIVRRYSGIIGRIFDRGSHRRDNKFPINRQ